MPLACMTQSVMACPGRCAPPLACALCDAQCCVLCHAHGNVVLPYFCACCAIAWAQVSSVLCHVESVLRSCSGGLKQPRFLLSCCYAWKLRVNMLTSSLT